MPAQTASQAPTVSGNNPISDDRLPPQVAAGSGACRLRWPRRSLEVPNGSQLSQFLQLFSLERFALAVADRRRLLEVLSLFPLANDAFLLDLPLEFFQRFFERFVFIYNDVSYFCSPPSIMGCLYNISERLRMSTTVACTSASGSTATPVQRTSQCK